MKLSTDEFKKLFESSGRKMSSKGRPIIDLELKSEGSKKTGYKTYIGTDGKSFVCEKTNRKVMNAVKVYDEQGVKQADSGWEYTCKQEMLNAGLEFEEQKKFFLLPTKKRTGLPTLKMRSWTPDFTFEKHKIVADAKGYVTEMARIKIHLFLHLYYDWDVVLLSDKSNLFTFINKIKQLENEQKR